MLISRREMLKRTTLAAGVGALSPMLLNLQAQASGKASPLPKRFVFLSRSNGLRTYGIDPVGIEDRMAKAGKGTDGTYYTDRLSEITLHEDLKALEPFKEKLNIIQGLSACMNVGAHSGSYGALGAYRCNENESPTMATLDVMLAEAFPSIFSHLGLAMVPLGTHIHDPRVSSSGLNSPVMFYGDPLAAYKDMFGIVGDKKLQQRIAMERDVLSFVKDDVKRTEQKLAGSERQKMGHYLQAFEAMSEREVKIAERVEAIKRGAPKANDKYTSEIGVDRLEAHIDMAAGALVTGLSNVVTVRLDHLGHHYRGLGMGSDSLHAYGHNEEGENLKNEGRHPTQDGITGNEGIRRVRRCHFELMALLAGKLDAVPEGDGTMLDNTLIVMLSDSGSAHHSNFSMFPFVTLGGLGGKLKTGQYINYANPMGGNPGRRSIRNYYHAIMHAVGLPDKVVGTNDNCLMEGIDQTAPLPELMA